MLQKLRALDAGVRVLVATGHLSPQEATRLREGGVRGIIYKPFRLEELQRQLEAALVS